MWIISKSHREIFFFFFDIFAIHSSSRHEKRCQISVRLFSLFRGSIYQQWDFKKPPFNYGLEIPFYSIIIIKGSPLCVLWFFCLLHIFSRRTVFSTDPFKNKISEIAFEIFIYKIFSKLLMLLRTADDLISSS